MNYNGNMALSSVFHCGETSAYKRQETRNTKLHEVPKTSIIEVKPNGKNSISEVRNCVTKKMISKRNGWAWFGLRHQLMVGKRHFNSYLKHLFFRLLFNTAEPIVKLTLYTY